MLVPSITTTHEGISFVNASGDREIDEVELLDRDARQPLETDCCGKPSPSSGGFLYFASTTKFASHAMRQRPS
jgi:hypothetical protein